MHERLLLVCSTACMQCAKGFSSCTACCTTILGHANTNISTIDTTLTKQRPIDRFGGRHVPWRYEPHTVPRAWPRARRQASAPSDAQPTPSPDRHRGTCWSCGDCTSSSNCMQCLNIRLFNSSADFLVHLESCTTLRLAHGTLALGSEVCQPRTSLSPQPWPQQWTL